MKELLLILALLLCAVPVEAAEGGAPGVSFFDKQKNYTDELYVLKDYLEFAVFDMSQMEVIDRSGTKKYVPPVVVEDKKTAPKGPKGVLALPTETLSEVAPEDSRTISAETEVRNNLAEVPKFFFQSLRRLMLSQNVPITVCSKDAPDYANPIKLYIKIKKITLYPVEINKKGDYNQSILLLIYGQLKDKRTGKILTRYYDSARTSFVLTKNQVAPAFASLAEDLMGGLVQFLSTRY